MRFDLLGGAYLLRALGLSNGFDQSLADWSGDTSSLSELWDSFRRTAGRMPPSSLAWALQSGGIASQAYVPRPNPGMCQCAHMYAPSPSFAFPEVPFDLEGFTSSRRRAKKLERLLRRDPFARAQVEMMLGGRIVDDGRTDGRIRVQPFAVGSGFGGGADPTALMALSALAQHQQGAAASGFQNNGQNQAFMNMMLGGLAAAYAGRGNAGGGGGGGGGLPRTPGGGSPFVNWAQPHPPVQNGPYQGAFGMNPGGNEVTAVLNDPSLTVEDKVCLMIMLIMKKMDKDIEKQAKYINSLQQQQNGGSGGKGMGSGGAPGGGSSPSIDVETMKLKRMIDKRSQMFDMLRQIIDKYNQTAKGIIDSIGR